MASMIITVHTALRSSLELNEGAIKASTDGLTLSDLAYGILRY